MLTKHSGETHYSRRYDPQPALVPESIFCLWETTWNKTWKFQSLTRDPLQSRLRPESVTNIQGRPSGSLPSGICLCAKDRRDKERTILITKDHNQPKGPKLSRGLEFSVKPRLRGDNWVVAFAGLRTHELREADSGQRPLEAVCRYTALGDGWSDKRGDGCVLRKLSSPGASTNSQGGVVPRTKATWESQTECKPV